MAHLVYNNSLLKMQNRGAIIRLLITGRCSSRVDIARETGLSKMAASNIINEFMEEGIIEESDKQKVCGKGRNPISLQLSSKAPKIIGVHITRNKCGACLCDMKLNTLDSGSFVLTEANHDRLMEMIFELVDGILRRNKEEKILGIGIGALGPVDSNSGKILNPPNFYGIHDLDVLSMFKERYSYPVFFEYEYNCAALTELYFGEGRDLEDFMFVGLSWGVGAGTVVQRELLRSSNGYAMEFGHTCIDYNGPLCNCGRRGCVEVYTSTLNIRKELIKITGEDLSFDGFCDKYRDSAPDEVDRLFKDMALKLSYGITNAVNLTCIENYIIGHGGSVVPDRYIKYCEQMVNERTLFNKQRKVKLIKSKKLGGVISESCACAVLDRAFRGEKDELFQ